MTHLLKKNWSLKKIYGNDQYYYKVDISDVEDLQNCLNDISKSHKDISVIVNNAGVTEDNLILEWKVNNGQKLFKLFKFKFPDN